MVVGRRADRNRGSRVGVERRCPVLPQAVLNQHVVVAGWERRPNAAVTAGVAAGRSNQRGVPGLYRGEMSVGCACRGEGPEGDRRRLGSSGGRRHGERCPPPLGAVLIEESPGSRPLSSSAPGRCPRIPRGALARERRAHGSNGVAQVLRRRFQGAVTAPGCAQWRCGTQGEAWWLTVRY